MERKPAPADASGHPEPAQGGVSDRFRVDNFDARAHRIGPADRDLLHELTVGVFWPHRRHDLDMFISLGEGYLAIDEIGRAMGSAMAFRTEDDFAMLGMMVTAPRLQSLGTGGWLLQRIMAECDGCDLRLSATRSGYRLYESAGFTPLRTIWQHQGTARPIRLPDAVPGVTLRPFAASDEAALRALDRHAYGAVRSRILTTLLAQSQTLVAEKDGALCGYAMMRGFGRGEVIGPLVAADEGMAMMLAAPLIRQAEGGFVRLDTPAEAERFRAFLSAAGMGVYDTVTEMYMGRQRRPLDASLPDGPQLFGLAAHSLG